MHTPARNSDPSTSHAAADYITTTGKRGAQQTMAATAVQQYPGLTSLELARRTSMDRYVLARRLPECEELRLVRRGEVRVCTASGRQALTWWPIDAAEQLPLAMDAAA